MPEYKVMRLSNSRVRVEDVDAADEYVDIHCVNSEHRLAMCSKFRMSTELTYEECARCVELLKIALQESKNMITRNN